MRDYNEISSLVKVSTNRKLAHEIRGWLVRMSKNLWVPDRCWPRICTSIASISRRRYEGELDHIPCLFVSENKHSVCSMSLCGKTTARCETRH